MIKVLEHKGETKKSKTAIIEKEGEEVTLGKVEKAIETTNSLDKMETELRKDTKAAVTTPVITKGTKNKR